MNSLIIQHPITYENVVELLHKIKDYAINDIQKDNDYQAEITFSTLKNVKNFKNFKYNELNHIEILPNKIYLYYYRNEIKIILNHEHKVDLLNPNHQIISNFIPKCCPHLNDYLIDNPITKDMSYNIFTEIKVKESLLGVESLYDWYCRLENDVVIPDFFDKCCQLAMISLLMYNLPKEKKLWIDSHYLKKCLNNNVFHSLTFEQLSNAFFNSINKKNKINHNDSKIIFLENNVLCSTKSIQLFKQLIDLQLLNFFENEIKDI